LKASSVSLPVEHTSRDVELDPFPPYYLGRLWSPTI
jgi:hypothetical protein